MSESISYWFYVQAEDISKKEPDPDDIQLEDANPDNIKYQRKNDPDDIEREDIDPKVG